MPRCEAEGGLLLRTGSGGAEQLFCGLPFLAPALARLNLDLALGLAPFALLIGNGHFQWVAIVTGGKGSRAHGGRNEKARLAFTESG